MSRHSQISVNYDGEALQEGRMDVRDLAPALLALGDLIEDANHILNGPESKVSVSVVSKFKRGSFGFEADIIQNLEFFDRATSLFTEGPQGTKEILELLFWGFAGGISAGELIRRIKGLAANISQHPEGNPKQQIVQFGNNTTVVNNYVAQSIASPKARNAWDTFSSPPRREGIDYVKVTGENPKENFEISVTCRLSSDHRLLENSASRHG